MATLLPAEANMVAAGMSIIVPAGGGIAGDVDIESVRAGPGAFKNTQKAEFEINAVAKAKRGSVLSST